MRQQRKLGCIVDKLDLVVPQMVRDREQRSDRRLHTDLQTAVLANECSHQQHGTIQRMRTLGSIIVGIRLHGFKMVPLTSH
jgi:hypothetical protein